MGNVAKFEDYKSEKEQGSVSPNPPQKMSKRFRGCC